MAEPIQLKDDYLTTSQAAKILQISTKTLLRLHRENHAGAPPRFRLAGLWRYSRKKLDAWCAERSSK